MRTLTSLIRSTTLSELLISLLGQGDIGGLRFYGGLWPSRARLSLILFYVPLKRSVATGSGLRLSVPALYGEDERRSNSKMDALTETGSQ